VRYVQRHEPTDRKIFLRAGAQSTTFTRAVVAAEARTSLAKYFERQCVGRSTASPTAIHPQAIRNAAARTLRFLMKNHGFSRIQAVA